MTEPSKNTRISTLLKASFDKPFWFFFSFATLMGTLCYFILGPDDFLIAIRNDVGELLGILPRMVEIRLLLAGFIWMIPPGKFESLVGRYRGFSGMLLAEFAGIITPGGPSAAFPFLAIIGRAGADRGIMVCYITSWALIGVQRIMVWDLPFMGAENTLTRLVVSLPLPLLAGLIANQLRFKPIFGGTPASQDQNPS